MMSVILGEKQTIHPYILTQGSAVSEISFDVEYVNYFSMSNSSLIGDFRIFMFIGYKQGI